MDITSKKQSNNDLYLTFFYKKVERITSALYLLTSSFLDDETLKWQLRRLGVSLLSEVTLLIRKESSSERKTILFKIEGIINNIISFLELAFTAEMVSLMNLEIFKREFELLLSLVKDKQGELVTNRFVLERNYFKIKDRSLQPKEIKRVISSVKDIPLGQGHLDKGHKLTKDISKTKTGVIPNADKRSSRQDNILKSLSKGQKLSVKDISKIIGGCGEKTIQRELQSMVKQGVLEKKGERRWSRYQLFSGGKK